jgi:hypothetical protein
MSSLKILAMTSAAFAFAIAQVATAAPAPNAKLWSGTWHLNAAKSKFAAPDTAEKSETRIYKIAGNHLTMRSTITTGEGKTIHWGYSAATDGKWYLTAGNPNTDHIALKSVSDREITSETMLNKKPSSHATVSVSANGKELTIDRTIVNRKSGPAHDVIVFDRK